jgi:ligand-binding SRPBCC domain-containing protein
MPAPPADGAVVCQTHEETMRVELTTVVHAPREICFDLARDLDLHLRSMAHTGEQAVAGRRSGLIGPGEQVTWRARHFGIVHYHTSRITAFDRPSYFRDSMVAGRFRTFEHDHFFEAGDGFTRMRDLLAFESPLGMLGRVVDRLVLAPYLTRMLEQRGRMIRAEAEQRGPGVGVDAPASELRSLARNLVDAWNRGDARAFAVLFTTDADYVTAAGERLRGRRAIAQLLERTAPRPEVHLVGEPVVECGTRLGSLSFAWSTAETSDPARRGRIGCTCLRHASGWLIEALQNDAPSSADKEG